MNNPNLAPSGYVTTRWVRDRYAISNSTMYEWIKAGRLPKPIRIGPRAVRFAALQLAEWEAKLLAPAPNAMAPDNQVPDKEKS